MSKVNMKVIGAGTMYYKITYNNKLKFESIWQFIVFCYLGQFFKRNNFVGGQFYSCAHQHTCAIKTNIRKHEF